MLEPHTLERLPRKWMEVGQMRKCYWPADKGQKTSWSGRHNILPCSFLPQKKINLLSIDRRDYLKLGDSGCHSLSLSHRLSLFARAASPLHENLRIGQKKTPGSLEWQTKTKNWPSQTLFSILSLTPGQSHLEITTNFSLRFFWGRMPERHIHTASLLVVDWGFRQATSSFFSRTFFTT